MILKRGNENTIEEVMLRNHPELKSLDELQVKKEEHIVNLSEAADRILSAIDRKEFIFIQSDYDDDGVMGAYELHEILNAYEYKEVFKSAYDEAEDITPEDGNYIVRFSRRMTEGYGATMHPVEEFKKILTARDAVSGLMVTIDNGISSYEPIKAAKEYGIDVVIIDHHPLNDGEEVPPADVVVDPNVIPGSSFSAYCGGGLVYKLAEKMFEKKKPKGRIQGILDRILASAAVATIGDVVSLTDDNYHIVKEGLEKLVSKTGTTTGAAAVLETYGCDKICTAKDVAFNIVPANNAPGRLFDTGARMAYDTWSFNGNVCVAKSLAEKLHAVNEKRKDLVQESVSALKKNIRDNGLEGDNPIVVYEPGLPPGLLGIFAGKVTELYGVSSFVMSDSGVDGIIKGSGRASDAADIKVVMDENADLLYKYGGHPKAAGIEIELKNLKKVRAAFKKSIKTHKMTQKNTLSDTLYDLEITSADIPEIMPKLEQYGPFGEGNPQIVFLVKDFTLLPQKNGPCFLMGATKEHIKFKTKEAAAVGFGYAKKYYEMGNVLTLENKEAKNWEMTDIASGKVIAENLPTSLNIAGVLETNHWFNKWKGTTEITTQVEIKDFEAAGKEMGK